MSPLKNPSGNPRILVAPLDWGLGHATRCIPVIYELMSQNAEVWIAGEGSQEAVLREEFPSLPFLSLRGYRVKYGRSAGGFVKNLLIQWPKIIRAVKHENEWLKDAIDKYEFDAVISDNRFGLFHDKVPCIFITHQLFIKAPFAERLVQNINYRYINKFKECWVPDNNNNLAGQLSHPEKMPAIPVSYIGLLSRLKKANNPIMPKHLFISLSGPEPQRSLLEDKLVNQLSHYNGTAVLVRGLPNAQTIIPSTNDIRFYNHLSTGEYEKEMAKAEYVISRSGYSTVMDCMTLGKKSIFIPTPGQTEQVYLGKYLEEKGIAISFDQKEFLLDTALQKANNFPFREVEIKESNLSQTIASLLKRI